jgi:hypothetical protein
MKPKARQNSQSLSKGREVNNINNKVNKVRRSCASEGKEDPEMTYIKN